MPRFVVHRHAATHLHYDLRLEAGGVLKSWAVPRGMPEETGTKRLAVAVQDHMLDYIGFEGTIPEGRYGAGTVEVWDAGTYEAQSWKDEKIVFTLKGRRLSGRYALVRMKGNNWLVMKLKGG
ncbi:MAG: DNA polymerase ligase N-terminal domain-containing protein [Thermodesulfobacteriota bacterium]